jgi:CRP/FNR family transcriptional regulator
MANRLLILPKKQRRGGRAPESASVAAAEEHLTATLVDDALFCRHHRQSLDRLTKIGSPVRYPKGSVVFVEGQKTRGVYVVSHGRVKLSSSSGDGKSLILRIAEAGEVVGLPTTVADKPHEASAEALDALEVNFVPRNKFLQFLGERSEAALCVAEILSDMYLSLHREVKHLVFSGSSAERLARLLLDMTSVQARSNGWVPGRLSHSHSEIAAMIGVCRETVTRLLALFRRERLVELRRSTIIVRDRAGLAKLLDA